MKIDIFLKFFDQKQAEGEKYNFIKSHVKDIYIPIEKKIDIANKVIDKSYTIKSDEEKHIYTDSVTKYISTCMALFDTYTDIERINKNNPISDFDKLNERKIFDYIIDNINQRELKEFNMVIQMVTDDLFTNKYFI